MRNTFSRSVHLFALAFVALAGWTSCTKENASSVNQDRIYTEYELFYDKNTDKTTAIARFKFGGVTGTLLELDSTSYVEFEGDRLPYNAILGAHAKEYAGLKTTGKFSYHNLDEETFDNTVPTMAAIAFPAIQSIPRSAAFTLAWDGAPLSAGQEVGVFINGINQADAQLFYQNALGATNIVLGTNQLGKLGLGEANCVMDLSTKQDVAKGTTVGGTILSKYRAKNLKVQVTE